MNNDINYCPFSGNRYQCPIFSGSRQKAEEYPIEQQAQPKTPPPNYTPKISDLPSPNLAVVQAGAITPCIFKNTYLWLRNGQSFWSYPVFINRLALSGWQYKGGMWVYFTVNLSNILNFTCT